MPPASRSSGTRPRSFVRRTSTASRTRTSRSGTCPTPQSSSSLIRTCRPGALPRGGGVRRSEPTLMASYIARRILWTILLLLVISFVTFLIFYVLPTADPAAQRAGRDPSPELIAAIRHQLGLDQSLLHQYWTYTTKLFFHFDFGESFINNTSVRALIFDRMPNTMFLVIGAAIIWFVSGVAIGIVSATRRGSFWDRFLMGGALIAISAPVYWMGLVALYLFSNDIGKWKIFPGAGAYQDAHGFFDKCWTMVMPWCVLAAAFAAIYARLLRSNLLETMSEDYIRTARAKGLNER